MPCKFRTAKQLVSHNIHTSNYNYKYTFSVEIVPVCKVHTRPSQLLCLSCRVLLSIVQSQVCLREAGCLVMTHLINVQLLSDIR